MPSGFVEVTGGGAQTVYYLGTGVSFNIRTLLPDIDYSRLTVDNFIVGTASAAARQANTYSSSGRKYASGGFVGFSLTKSYDPSTGILTIGGNDYYGWVWVSDSTYGTPPGDVKTDGTVTPFAYLVTDEIENV